LSHRAARKVLLQMNDQSNEPSRRIRRRDEKIIVLAGLLGLAGAGFVACGGDDTFTEQGTSDAGTDAGEDSDASVSGDAGVSADGGTDAVATSDAAGPTCSQSATTAANTAAVVTAAQTLYAALTAGQQTTIQLTATLANDEQWSNLPTTFIPRNGVMIGDMSEGAAAAAVALVTAATSDKGLTLFSELRNADEWLVTNGMADSNSYGYGRYYLSFEGTPSTTGTWQLQIAGHHLAYNFTYNGPCTSATPLFDGVEPTTWTDDAGTAHAPLESQRAAAVAVIAAVASDSSSLLAGTFTDVVNGPTNQDSLGDAKFPLGLSYPTGTTGRGANVGAQSTATQALVKTAIEAWVKNVSDDVSAVILADYESADSLAQTYVGYSGATDLTTQDSYFRIDGPRVWIEYTIQGGIVYQGRVHYHTLWRDKVSDYGAEYDDADAGAGAGATGDGGGGLGGFPGGDGGMGGPGGDGGMGGPPGG
jgi:hypothetical protein